MKKGFTLIELLVVLSIIGVLAALFLVSFSGSQKQARDTKRKSDLRQYQSVLENFANKNQGFYPSRNTSSISILCQDLEINNCQNDPRYNDDSSFSYFYQTDGSQDGTINATSYVLWAKLENKQNFYWVVCSSGSIGEVESTLMPPVNGRCPF